MQVVVHLLSKLVRLILADEYVHLIVASPAGQQLSVIVKPTRVDRLRVVISEHLRLGVLALV